MPIPKQKDIEVSLLEELVKAGGSVRPGDLYPKLAQRFGLTQTELAEVTSSGDNKFQKWVNFVRLKLVRENEIARLPRGVWTITDKGRRRADGGGGKEGGDTGNSGDVEVNGRREGGGGGALDHAEVGRKLLERLVSLKPDQFERAVGELLKAMGLSEIRILGRTADGGIDGEATIPVLNVRVCFQAKKWNAGNNVGGDPVRSFIGSRVAKGYDRGIFITTSGFTAGAKEAADSPDSKIVLVDGERLVAIMRERGLGVRGVPVVREDLDESFFAML